MFDQTPAANGKSTRSILWSVGIHGVAVIGLFALGSTVQTKLAMRRASVTLLAPMAVQPAKRAPAPAPFRLPEVHAVLSIPPARWPALAPPVIEPPPILKTPPVAIAVAETAPIPAPAAPPQPVIHTDVFATAAPVIKPLPIAPTQLQTGGFATASAASPQSGKGQQVASAGFGDAGIAPAAGARRAISTAAGFGDAGVATAAASSIRSISPAGFGDAVAAAPTATAARQTAAQQMTAAQILDKPRPAYSEEARRLQIEGEVQLEVLFRASGRVDILRLVRGLGHGLDENAAQAARTIRFLPAKRDGRPVDSTATVHIIFQLAS
jgi:TonB family protein